MNLSPYELALIAGGFTVIGALIGGLIGYKNAISIYKITEFNKAATRFQLAFYNELIFLKHNAIVGKMGSTDDLSNVLSFGYLHRHLKAFEVFRNYLSSEDKIGIDKAWKQYCYCDEKPEILFFEKYFTGGRPKSEVEAKKALALERIEEILKYAKHK